MIGSVVRLAEYLCTHVCLITVAEENPAPADGFYIDVDSDESLDTQTDLWSL